MDISARYIVRIFGQVSNRSKHRRACPFPPALCHADRVSEPTPEQPAAAPGSRAHRRSRRRPTVKRVLLWLVGLGLAGLLAGVLVVLFLYTRTEIPDPAEFADSQSSILYYSDGQTELARFTGGTNRESVPLTQVPDHVEQAMLAAEDRSFYSNQGVSVTGTVRALWNNLTSDTTQGGSTITQQYVKNYFLSQEQSYARKIDEALIAVKIDRELTKDQILESYLNTIYYGRGAYGIQTASQAYFRKDVADLTVSEGAFLAAVTNAPSLFDPDYADGNKERAQERFAYVIDGMVAEGWLSQADADAATFPTIEKPEPTSATTGGPGLHRHRGAPRAGRQAQDR